MRCFMVMPLLVCLLDSSSTAQASIQQFDVRFHNGDVELAGTILAPPGEGPYPAMVLVHGSGPAERTELLETATRFTLEGIVILIYDKRGTGRSGGNWISSSLADLAADAAAGLRYLAEQPRVDPRRSGFWAISQGGWVVPLAAKLSSPAFIIVVTGGGLSPKEIETARYRAIVRQVDNSQEATDAAELLIAAYFDYLADLISHEALQEKIEAVKLKGWFDATGIANVIPAPKNRRNWEWVATFNPKKSIEDLAIPVLVLLGSSDSLTPADDAARAWRDSLPHELRGNEVIVVPNAGHGMRTRPHGGDFVAEYFSTQFDWLRANDILEVHPTN